jgi:hypothetical protein
MRGYCARNDGSDMSNEQRVPQLYVTQQEAELIANCGWTWAEMGEDTEDWEAFVQALARAGIANACA